MIAGRSRFPATPAACGRPRCGAFD